MIQRSEYGNTSYDICNYIRRGGIQCKCSNFCTRGGFQATVYRAKFRNSYVFLITDYDIYASYKPILLYLLVLFLVCVNHSVDIFICCLRLLFMKCLLTVDEFQCCAYCFWFMFHILCISVLHCYMI